MVATSYTFYSHSTSFALSSLLLLYMLFHECHWLAVISESQTKRISHSETFLFMQNTGTTTVHSV